MTDDQAVALAVEMIRTRPPEGWDPADERVFDKCFERGVERNGVVVRAVIDLASKDARFKRRVIDAGFGYWLEPGYMERRLG